MIRVVAKEVKEEYTKHVVVEMRLRPVHRAEIWTLRVLFPVTVPKNESVLTVLQSFHVQLESFIRVITSKKKNKDLCRYPLSQRIVSLVISGV